MSKGKIFLIVLLCVVMATSFVLGLTFLFKQSEDKVVSSEEKIEQLTGELNLSIKNVSKLNETIKLNGVTIADLNEEISQITAEKVVLEEKIKVYETAISEKDKLIVEYQEQIVILEGQSDVDKETISSLQENIVTITNEKEVLIAEKNELQQSIVDKNTIIAENEEEIAELESTNAQLVINIDILNETIVNLNVQIEALQSQLEKDPSKLYFEDLFLNSRVDFVQVNSDYSLVNGGVGKPLYLMNLSDYSLTKVKDNFYLDFNSYPSIKISDNLLYVPGGDTWNDNHGGFVLLDTTTAEIVCSYSGTSNFSNVKVLDGFIWIFNERESGLKVSLEDYSITSTNLPANIVCFYPLENNKYFFAVALGFDGIGDCFVDNGYYVYDLDSDTYTQCSYDNNIDTSWVSVNDPSVLVLSNSDLLFCNGLSSVGGLYFYDYSSNLLTKVTDGLVGYDSGLTELTEEFVIGSYSNDNYFVNLTSLQVLDISSVGIDTSNELANWFVADDNNVLFVGPYGFGLIDTVDNSLTKVVDYTGAVDYINLDTGVIVKITTSDNIVYSYYYDYSTKQVGTDLPASQVNLVNGGTYYYYHDSVTTGYYPCSAGSLILPCSSAYVGETIIFDIPDISSGYSYRGIGYSIGNTKYIATTGTEVTITSEMVADGNVVFCLLLNKD